MHQNCVWDWVQVIDGNGQELLKKSCGNEKPENFFSKTNKATVKFHSDGMVVKKGFSLQYSFQTPSDFGGKHTTEGNLKIHT